MYSTLKIHIFRTTGPKITNNISLDSLKSVESKYAETCYGYFTKIWTKFKMV
jgi:hypothetical protein